MDKFKDFPLYEELHILLENLANANGMLFQIQAHLKGYVKIYQKGTEGKGGFDMLPILSSTLFITDISRPNDSSNNIIWDYGYCLYLKEMYDRFEMITSRIAMRELSYCYDIFETFLKDITAKFLFLNYEGYVDELKTLFKNELKAGKKLQSLVSVDTVRKKLHNLTRDGNKELFELVRRICPELRKVEKTNYAGVNLVEWFKALKTVRDSVIHSNFMIREHTFIHNEVLKKSLQEYFSAQVQSDGMTLNMTERDARNNIEVVANYGFQIFKHFCLAGGYEWRAFAGLK